MLILSKMYSCEVQNVKRVFKETVMLIANDQGKGSRIYNISHLAQIRHQTEIDATKQSIQLRCIANETPAYITLAWIEELKEQVFQEMSDCLNSKQLFNLGKIDEHHFNKYISLEIIASNRGWDMSRVSQCFEEGLLETLSIVEHDKYVQLALLNNAYTDSSTQSVQDALQIEEELGVAMRPTDTPSGLGMIWISRLQAKLKKQIADDESYLLL